MINRTGPLLLRRRRGKSIFFSVPLFSSPTSCLRSKNNVDRLECLSSHFRERLARTSPYVHTYTSRIVSLGVWRKLAQWCNDTHTEENCVRERQTVTEEKKIKEKEENCTSNRTKQKKMQDYASHSKRKKGKKERDRKKLSCCCCCCSSPHHAKDRTRAHA